MSVTVIKVGGSLLKNKNLKDDCARLSSIGKSHCILIIPGGGIFADAVRDSSRSFDLDHDTSHWMAILAMNQYGYLLSSLIHGSICTENIDEALKCAEKYQPVILLPYKLMKDKDPLPHSWDVTSDSIAAWVAGFIKAERLVLVKSKDMSLNSSQSPDCRSPVDIEGLKETGMVDPMFYTIMKEIKMWSEDKSGELYLCRRESKDQPIPGIPAFAGMAGKNNITDTGQPAEKGLWIVNGNCPEQLTCLFKSFHIQKT